LHGLELAPRLLLMWVDESPSTDWECNMFRTITSRYAGTCKRCHQPFEAGTKIRFGGYGRTYHLKAHCAATADELPSDTRDNGYAAQHAVNRATNGAAGLSIEDSAFSQEWAETQADDLGESPDF
jgi:hypothetical protein